MLFIDIDSLCSMFAISYYQKYVPDAVKRFAKIFCRVDTLEAYNIIISFSCMLQDPFCKLLHKFLNHKNNKNTYKFIVLFRRIIGLFDNDNNAYMYSVKGCILFYIIIFTILIIFLFLICTRYCVIK